MICFSCDEVGHIDSKCPNKDNKDEKKFNKYKGKKDFKSYKSYKDKDKKSCYIAKDYDSDEDEMVYIYVTWMILTMNKMERLPYSSC